MLFEVFEKLTSACFFKLHEKPCYYLLIISFTKLCRISHTLASREKKFIHFWLSIFSQRKNIYQNDRSRTMCFNYKNFEISKIALYFLFWHCISLKLHCSQPIRIEKLFSCILYSKYTVIIFVIEVYVDCQILKFWISTCNVLNFVKIVSLEHLQHPH